MRIIKPQQLVFLKNCYQIGEQSYIGISIVAGFCLSRKIFITEPEIWQGWQSAPLSWKVLDGTEPKPFAEFLIAGHATLVKGELGRKLSATVGGITRQWYIRAEDSDNNEEVRRIPLDHTQSFGGESYPENPLGIGNDNDDMPALFKWLEHEDADGRQIQCDPLAAPTPLPPDFYQRKQWLDRVADEMNTPHYINHYFPGFPPSLDDRFFQTAPESQWLDQPEWPSNVMYSLTGFGENNDELSGYFPQVQAQAFYQYKDGADTELEILPLQKKTLWLLPDSNTGLMVFTGRIKTSHILAEDVQCILVALDHQDAPRGYSHYESVYKKRTAKDCNEFEFLFDPDLMPEDMPLRVIDSPDKHPSSVLYQHDKSDDSDDANIYYQQIKKHINESKKKEEIVPVDKSLLLSEVRKIVPKVVNPNFNAFNVNNGEKKNNLNFEHVKIDLDLEGAVFEYCSFYDCEFNEVIFSRCDFKFCQFEKCHFKQSNFNQSIFSQCRFSDSLFQNSKLSNCKLDRLNIKKMGFENFKDNFSEWKTCQFEKVNMSEAIFQGSILTSCSFSNSELRRWQAVDVHLDSILFIESILSHSEFKKVSLDKCSILDGLWNAVSFVECVLESTTVKKDTDFSGVIFSDSKINKLGFTGGHLPLSIFSQCSLSEYTFDEANMRGVQFLQCDMPGGRFMQSVLEDSVWDRSSLQQVVFYNSILYGANFNNCNLIAANMAMVRKNSDSHFINCLTDKICYDPAYKNDDVSQS